MQHPQQDLRAHASSRNLKGPPQAHCPRTHTQHVVMCSASVHAPDMQRLEPWLQPGQQRFQGGRILRAIDVFLAQRLLVRRRGRKAGAATALGYRWVCEKVRSLRAPAPLLGQSAPGPAILPLMLCAALLQLWGSLGLWRRWRRRRLGISAQGALSRRGNQPCGVAAPVPLHGHLLGLGLDLSEAHATKRKHDINMGVMMGWGHDDVMMEGKGCYENDVGWNISKVHGA